MGETRPPGSSLQFEQGRGQVQNPSITQIARYIMRWGWVKKVGWVLGTPSSLEMTEEELWACQAPFCHIWSEGKCSQGPSVKRPSLLETQWRDYGVRQGRPSR